MIKCWGWNYSSCWGPIISIPRAIYPKRCSCRPTREIQMKSIGSIRSGILFWEPLIGGWVKLTKRCRIKGTGVNEVDVGEVAIIISC